MQVGLSRQVYQGPAGKTVNGAIEAVPTYASLRRKIHNAPHTEV